MSGELFIDESKHYGFRLVAAFVAHDQIVSARRQMRALLQPGQQRVHFRKEKDGRKRSILAAIAGLDLRAFVIVLPRRVPPNPARQLALRKTAHLSADLGVYRLTLETETTTQEYDRRTLYEQLSRYPAEHRASYQWLRADQEPLLWVPDAIAWCWSKGGHWRQLADSSVEIVVHQVEP